MVCCDAKALRLDCASVLCFEVQVLSYEEGNEVLPLIITLRSALHDRPGAVLATPELLLAVIFRT